MVFDHTDTARPHWNSRRDNLTDSVAAVEPCAANGRKPATADVQVGPVRVSDRPRAAGGGRVATVRFELCSMSMPCRRAVASAYVAEPDARSRHPPRKRG